MLKVENIVKYYGKNCAVNNLSFEVKNGEIFGLYLVCLEKMVLEKLQLLESF